MSQGKILDIHGQKNWIRVSATALENQRLSSSPYQDLGSRDLVFSLGREPGEHWRLGRCESASLIKGRYDPVCKIKNPLTGRGEDIQEGKVKMEYPRKMEIQDWPYILAKRRSAAVSCKSCTAVWNLLSCSYRCKPSSYTMLPKRALPVLASIQETPWIAGLPPLLPPLGRKPGIRFPAPSGYTWPLHKSVLTSLPRLCSPESFLSSSDPGWRAIPPPTSSSPRGQPTSGRASRWSAKTGKPWPVPIMSLTVMSSLSGQRERGQHQSPPSLSLR